MNCGRLVVVDGPPPFLSRGPARREQFLLPLLLKTPEMRGWTETLVLFAPLANSRPRICGDDPGLTINTLSWQPPDMRGKTSRKEQGPGTVHIKAHRADPRHNEHQQPRWR